MIVRIAILSLLLIGCAAHRVPILTPEQQAAQQIILNLQVCVTTGTRSCDSQWAAYRALVMRSAQR